ncbi:MAG: putative ABC transport system permease protein [Candidatus Peregrinibacteria bacterium Gr01-1014_25]|nr:MAG: putative ABC transport system permease protein [Candidatus Peregrinibacteria bacterium Gr01-1014_25]
MNSNDLLRTALRGLRTNRARAAMTMLGIVIGVASVALMLSLGRSFQSYILTQIDRFGTNTIDIFPVGLEKFGGNLDSLTLDDARAVARLSTVRSVAPVIVVGKPVRFEDEERSPMVMGTTREIFGNYGLELEAGRLLDAHDDDSTRFVTVLAADTARELFGDIDPVGRRVDIGGFSFTVVGVLKGMGSLLLQDLDSMVYVPFNVARSITAQKHVTYITLKAAADPQLAKQDILSLLRQRHRIRNPENDPDKDDVIVRSAEQVTSIVQSVTLGLTVFLGLVAAISLIVGGIGIMNIMLASVTERTREIGLRKAVGARHRDILWQFLCEAVSLTAFGGAVGLLFGTGMGWMLTRVASRFLGEVPFALSPVGAILALVMAAGTGLVFGVFPARKAARLSPMEALRYE